MKVIIKRNRYNDTHTYTHVKNVVVKKTGRVFPDMEIDVEFGKGATSHYVSEKHNEFWEIDPNSNPGAGSSRCSQIEIYEDDDTSDRTIIAEDA